VDRTSMVRERSLGTYRELVDRTSMVRE
jgi:hypothetical protein